MNKSSNVRWLLPQMVGVALILAGVTFDVGWLGWSGVILFTCFPLLAASWLLLTRQTGFVARFFLFYALFVIDIFLGIILIDKIWPEKEVSNVGDYRRGLFVLGLFGLFVGYVMSILVTIIRAWRLRRQRHSKAYPALHEDT